MPPVAVPWRHGAAWAAWAACALASGPTKSDVLTRALLRVAARFLGRDENGAFVEVLFGEGSAAFLRAAVRSCLEEGDESGRGPEAG